MISKLIKNDTFISLHDNGALKGGIYSICDNNFNYAIINGTRIEYFNIFLNSDINEITYLEFINNEHIIMYFKNNKLHNMYDAAWYSCDIYDKKVYTQYYYIEGIEYIYDDWLKHPERIRYLRNEKLQIL